MVLTPPALFFWTGVFNFLNFGFLIYKLRIMVDPSHMVEKIDCDDRQVNVKY